MTELYPDVLLRRVRIVPVTGAAPEGEVDLRIRRGRVIELGPGLAAYAGERVHDAQGRFAIPGLWDHHVHLTQWGASAARLDTSGTAGPEAVCRLVAARVAGLPAGADRETIQGWGHRSATWSRQPTVAELDAVSGGHPVVLVAGDGHNGWLNSRALGLLGLSGVTGLLDEDDWFPLFSRLAELPGVAGQSERGLADAVCAASAMGVVGVVDLEWAPLHRVWPERFAAGVTQLRVRGGVYEPGLEEVLELGLRSGEAFAAGEGLLTMGSLKIISDGSLNTRTAYCCEPYVDAVPGDPAPRGKHNTPLDHLIPLLGRAKAAGLDIALHAIGDAAVAAALDAFEATGQRGSIEHAQLMTGVDVERMGRLGVAASVQPAHLLDDRDVTMRCWPDRHERCFPFRSLLNAGVELRLGSDAPVSPLDPWLAMAAAVHRSADDRDPWNPGEALTTREALAASTDGQGTIGLGSRADIVLLDADPLAATGDTGEQAAYLRRMPVAATLVAGRLVHDSR